MTAIPFPKAKKRGAKVRKGPLATILNFPQGRSPAERYALVMAAGYEPKNYEQAIKEYLEIALRLTENGMIDAASVERTISNRRERLLRELQRLDCI